LTKLSIENNRDTRLSYPHFYSTLLQDDIEIQQTAWSISPGIFTSHHFNQLGIFAGFEIFYGSFGSLTYRQNGEWLDTLTMNVISSGETNTDVEGGYSYGISASGGFQFYFAKKISVGVEITSLISYYKLGGEIKTEDILLSPVYDRREWQGHNLITSQWELKLIPSLNISINF